MLRPILPALAVLALALPAAADSWRPYVNADQGVRAEFPGEFSVSTRTEPSTVGDIRTTVAEFSDTDANGADYYALSSSTFAIDAPDAEGLVAASASGAIEGVKGRIVSSQKVTIDGAPGVELTAEIDNSGTTVRVYGRFLFKNATLHQGIVVDAQPYNEAEGWRFVRSVRLTK